MLRSSPAADAVPRMNIAYVAFSTRQPLLNDIRLRHAIALAINNLRLMQPIYCGTAEETTASLLPSVSWAYYNDARVTDYNPAKARTILRKLGKPSLHFNPLVPMRRNPIIPARYKTPNLPRPIWRRWGYV